MKYGEWIFPLLLIAKQAGSDTNPLVKTHLSFALIISVTLLNQQGGLKSCADAVLYEGLNNPF